MRTAAYLMLLSSARSSPREENGGEGAGAKETYAAVAPRVSNGLAIVALVSSPQNKTINPEIVANWTLIEVSACLIRRDHN